MSAADEWRNANRARYRAAREAIIKAIREGDADPTTRLIAALYEVCPDCGATEPCGHGPE